MNNKGFIILILILILFLGFYIGNYQKENFNFTILRPYQWRRGSSTYSPSQYYLVADNCN